MVQQNIDNLNQGFLDKSTDKKVRPLPIKTVDGKPVVLTRRKRKSSDKPKNN